MGYAINAVTGLGAPFLIVHQQVVLIPAQGSLSVSNTARKILFVLRGECRHQVMGWEGRWKNVHLRQGDILALPHHCEQRYFSLQPGTATQLHVVRLAFDPERLPPLPLNVKEPDILKGQGGPPQTQENHVSGVSGIETLAGLCLREIQYLRDGQDSSIQEDLSHLRDEARRRPPEYHLRVYCLCFDLTVLFARKVLAQPAETVSPEANGATSDYHVGKIKDYLRGHLNQPPRLAQIARHINLSEEYTTRLFKKATGMTLSEYGRWLRIVEAKNLLATTEKNLSQIAQATGFASLTVFSRNFKREEGITPSEFRRQIACHMG